MKVKAKLNNLRIAPRKVRLVVDLIRGLDVETAKNQLHFLPKKSSTAILKLLNSAVANAKNNFKMDVSNLYIAEIFAGEGITMKRLMPRAMGRGARIRKRTSNVTLVLADRNEPASAKAMAGKKAMADKAEVLKKTKVVKEKIEKIEKSSYVPKGASEGKEAAKDHAKEKTEKNSEAKAHKGVKRITGMAKRTFKEHNK